MTRRLALLTVASFLACGPATPAPQSPPPAASPAAPPAAAPAPAPVADPAPVTDGDVTAAWMNGMQILVKRVPGAELVAVQLYVRGGVRNWNAQTAGVERLALNVATTGGTTRMPKDAFVQRLATLGSSIGASGTNDYSALVAKSLRPHWVETFGMLVDAFLHPALPAGEIELQRQRQLSELKREQESPDDRLAVRAHLALYQDHPYEHREIGSIPVVQRLAAKDLAAHLARLRETGRLLLVVVGDVDASEVLAQARAALGKLPRGGYRETPIPAVSFDRARLVTFTEKLPTNYIASVFPGPRWTDADLPTAMVAMEVLGWREFEEIRTKRNLSYAPRAGLRAGHALAVGLISVSTVDPNAAMKVMMDEARRLKAEPVPAKELNGAKSTFLTGYLMRGQGTDGQAALLARAQLLTGDWRSSRTLPGRVRAVTAAEVQAWARRAIVRLQTVLQGDPAKLDPTLVTSL